LTAVKTRSLEFTRWIPKDEAVPFQSAILHPSFLGSALVIHEQADSGGLGAAVTTGVLYGFLAYRKNGKQESSEAPGERIVLCVSVCRHGSLSVRVGIPVASGMYGLDDDVVVARARQYLRQRSV
jgi:hypothetical protein